MRKLEQLSDEDLREIQRKVITLLVRGLSERSKTPEELMQWRDEMLDPSPLPQHPIVMECMAEMEKTVHEKILEKGITVKAIKGGRRQKRNKAKPQR